jgi:hypothetical protein
MTVYVNVATVTKAELLRVLEGVPDEAKVYVMATHETACMAIEGAKVEPRDVYFGLSANSTQELGGIALVAEFRPE